MDVTLRMGRKVAGLIDLLKNCDYPVAENGQQRFRMKPYGYLWLREGRGPESLAGVLD